MNRKHIQDYLEGKVPDSEMNEIREWLKNPENDTESRKILGEIWANSDIRVVGTEPDFEQMLNQVHFRINKQMHRPLSAKSQPEGLIRRFYNTFSKIAAILAIPLLLLSIYFYFNSMQSRSSVASSTVREIYTKPGTRTKIELSDGTLVWLNDGTTFRYAESFSDKKREVFVDGEAYFEVKADPENPFVVNNPMMKTIVTGTHFNLHAYSADNYFEATLQEGKVSLERNNQKLEIKPGEQVQFDSMLETIVQKTVDPFDAAAWVDGKLIFKDEKLTTAIKKLARWYNVEIILSEPEIDGYLLTGTIQDEKLDQTLNMISLALPVKFEFKKENNPTKIQRTIYMTRK